MNWTSYIRFTKTQVYFCVLLRVIKYVFSLMETTTNVFTQKSGIIIPNSDFDFSKLHLADPIAIQGGSYFTKMTNDGLPIYIQTPQCHTKQGFTKSGKKIYSDLIFNNNDEMFVQWLIDMETKCEELIYEKSSEWFQNPLELDDIESAFNSCMKIQKTGNYIVRANVKLNSLTQDPLIKIYSENENSLNMEDVIPDTNIIVILELKGIKFTSRNFQMDIEAKQVMVLNKDIFENCLISIPTKSGYTQVLNNSEVKPTEENDTSIDKIKQDTNEEEILGKIQTINTNSQSESLNNNEEKVHNDSLEESKSEPKIESVLLSIDKMNLDDNTNDKENDNPDDNSDIVNSDDDSSYDDSDSYSDSDSDLGITKLTLGESVNIPDIPLIDEQEKQIASANILSENKPNLIDRKDEVVSALYEPDNDISLEIDELNNSSSDKPLVSDDTEVDTLVNDILEDIQKPQNDELKEYDIGNSTDNMESITLKKPSEYYYQLYKEVRNKAKEQKQLALENFMKARDIKNTHMIDDISDTSDDIQNIGSDIEDELE